jgi:hypothetical protein
MGGIADQSARSGSAVNFGIVGLREGECTAANFSKVFKRRGSTKPDLMGHFSFEGRGSSEVCEVGSCCTEFIPHGSGCIARESHGLGPTKDSSVKAFSTTIVRRHIGGGKLVFDAVFGTPVCHGFGNKFTVIGH